jgi:hypothetical protein
MVSSPEAPERNLVLVMVPERCCDGGRAKDEAGAVQCCTQALASLLLLQKQNGPVLAAAGGGKPKSRGPPESL